LNHNQTSFKKINRYSLFKESKQFKMSDEKEKEKRKEKNEKRENEKKGK
jgi:hypothetical protein